MWSRVAAMAMRGSRGAGRGRGYGRGGFGRGGGGSRHPSHLKGKEIGMFYKNKGLQKKRQQDKAERAVVGMSDSTKSDLDSLLCEVKREQGVAEMPMSSGSGGGGVFSHISQTLPTSRKSLSRDPTLDAALQDELKETHKKSHSSYRKLQEFRRTLPCYSMREEIVSKIRDNQVIVLSGETGCGKTTQIPQFILDDAISRGCGSATHVVCTQPRRISAISVAARVSEERGENPSMTNGSVGHQIRLETRLPRPQGSILYCTTGVMIRWLISLPLLDNCSHIILDEVHERDVLIDFLMIIIRDLLPKRPDLKLVIMSATLHAELLSHYFSDCPIIQVPGRVFPVTIHHLEELLPEMRYKRIGSAYQRPFYGGRKRGRYSEEDAKLEDFNRYVSTLPPDQQEFLSQMSFKSIDHDLVVHTVKHLYHTTQDGAILVFLPGWTDISQVHDKIMKDPVLSSHLIIPLHSMLPMASQKEVFDRPPPGVRKIILSTSIAETSITIDDVVYVVDAGKTKEGTFDVSRNISCLDPVWVSQASAKQRQGRAGRVQSGHCLRLYTRWHYDKMLEYQLPEMLRTPLEELILQIKILRLGSAGLFLEKALQPPQPDAVTMAIEKLTYLQALDANEELTALGYHLAKLPISPSIGKAILFGAILSCLDPVLTICAVLGFKDPFVIPLHKQKEADTARRRFAGESRSDHIAYYNAYKEWERSGEQRSFCWRNFLSHNTLEMIKKNKRQFAELLMEIGFLSSSNPTDPSSNVNSRNLQLTKAVLCAGLYPNVATVVSIGGHRRNPSRPSRPPRPPKLYTENDGRIHIHPKSVNCNIAEYSSKHLIYYIKVKSSKIFIHDCTMVTPFPLLFFGGDVTASKDEEQEIIQVDKHIKFQAPASIAHLVKELKTQLNSLLEQKIANPLPDFSSTVHSSKLIQAIIELICNEDTTQVQHFPNEISKRIHHAGRYLQYQDSDSDDEEHGDETKL